MFETNFCNSVNSLIKKVSDHCRTIPSGKSTTKTPVIPYTSILYTNKSETTLQTKPFIASLNRSSGIN